MAVDVQYRNLVMRSRRHDNGTSYGRMTVGMVTKTYPVTIRCAK